MDCSHFRQLLFARSGEWSYEQRGHLIACAECARLARDADAFERAIEDAVMVPVPDDLEHQIVLRNKCAPSWGGFIAAVFARALRGP